MQSFEDYLRDIHAETYKGTDDDMSDNFNTWIGDMDINECIQHAEDYGEHCYEHARRNKCAKCGNSNDMYWCGACQFSIETDTCPCGSRAVSDPDYHLACK